MFHGRVKGRSLSLREGTSLPHSMEGESLMVPTKTLTDRVAALLATDVTTLAAAAVKHVHLIQAPFSPGPNTDLAALNVATFNTYAPLSAPAGNQANYYDPTIPAQVVELIDPAGGWHWQAGSNAALPQTIYGWVVTDVANAVTYGSELFPTPITLAQTGDGLTIGDVKFALVPPVLQ
jgi:hypothetical protein